jgi:hypothetical protein
MPTKRTHRPKRPALSDQVATSLPAVAGESRLRRDAPLATRLRRTLGRMQPPTSPRSQPTARSPKRTHPPSALSRTVQPVLRSLFREAGQTGSRTVSRRPLAPISSRARSREPVEGRRAKRTHHRLQPRPPQRLAVFSGTVLQPPTPKLRVRVRSVCPPSICRSHSHFRSPPIPRTPCTPPLPAPPGRCPWRPRCLGGSTFRAKRTQTWATWRSWGIHLRITLLARRAARDRLPCSSGPVLDTRASHRSNSTNRSETSVVCKHTAR